MLGSAQLCIRPGDFQVGVDEDLVVLQLVELAEYVNSGAIGLRDPADRVTVSDHVVQF